MIPRRVLSLGGRENLNEWKEVFRSRSPACLSFWGGNDRRIVSPSPVDSHLSMISMLGPMWKQKRRIGIIIVAWSPHSCSYELPIREKSHIEFHPLLIENRNKILLRPPIFPPFFSCVNPLFRDPCIISWLRLAQNLTAGHQQTWISTSAAPHTLVCPHVLWCWRLTADASLIGICACDWQVLFLSNCNSLTPDRTG